MPRPKPQRSVGGEKNLAERIRLELARRGWSPADLAEKMTDKGCKIGTSSVYKILDTEKPRTISVDEFISLATVFETTTEDLLTPVEALDQQRAKELLQVLDAADEQLAEAVTASVTAYVELFEIAEEDRELFEYITNHRFRQGTDDEPRPLFEVHDDHGRAVDVDDSIIREALHNLALAEINQASIVVRGYIND